MLCFISNSGTKRPRESGKLESAPDPELVKLGKWVKRQRRHYAIDKLPPERLSALKEINFEFKPGNATKEERISVQLGLLDALRKRRELSNAQVADLNFLYDEWKRRAEEGVTVPVHVQNSEEGKNKFDLKWMQKFEELKDFKVINVYEDLLLSLFFLIIINIINFIITFRRNMVTPV